MATNVADNFKISNFLSKMPNDGLRPNLFDVRLYGLNTNWSGLGTDNITFKARATSIPGSNLGTVGLYYFGRPIVFGGNRTYDPWSIAVIMDENDYDAASGGLRGLFEKWIDFINGNNTNARNTAALTPASSSTTNTGNSSNGYFCSGVVRHLGKQGNVLAAYKMENCFPVSISPMSLDWGANGSIGEFQVSFALHYWQRISIDTDSITTDTNVNLETLSSTTTSPLTPT